MNGELERMRKEAAVTRFGSLQMYLQEELKNTAHILVTLVGIATEIRAARLPIR